MPARRVLLRVAQAAFVAALLYYAARLLAERWTEVRALRATVRTDWGGVLLASLLVLVSYAILIATWRATVGAWGQRLPVRDAVRIWFISNLGRYVPGKVWQIGAMGVMAKEAGVSPLAAVGSALVVSLVHVLVGFGVVALTGRSLLDGAIPGASAVAALAVMALTILAAPWLLPFAVRGARRVTGREFADVHLPPRAIWFAAAGSAAAWLCFGIAFRLLAGALLGTAAGDVGSYIAVFTLSYLLGFLALFAPGGIGVRELSMAALLVTAGLATHAEAAWLVVGSRLWLTVLEILPGALLLLLPRRALPTTPAP